MLLLLGALLLPQAPAHAGVPAFDSTVAAVNAVTVSVAQVRSGLDQLRRAAWNRESSGRVLELTSNLRGKCRATIVEIERAEDIACPDCLDAARQRVVNEWLRSLRQVRLMASRCDRELGRMAADRNADSGAVRVRRQLDDQGRRILEALHPYFEHVQRVRAEFGRAATPPRRS